MSPHLDWARDEYHFPRVSAKQITAESMALPAAGQAVPTPKRSRQLS